MSLAPSNHFLKSELGQPSSAVTEFVELNVRSVEAITIATGSLTQTIAAVPAKQRRPFVDVRLLITEVDVVSDPVLTIDNTRHLVGDKITISYTPSDIPPGYEIDIVDGRTGDTILAIDEDSSGVNHLSLEANNTWTETQILVAAAGGGGSGDVTAGSSFGTDNRAIRSDGTGKGVQVSPVTIADTTGTITTPGLLIAGSGPTTLTDSAGKVLSASINTVGAAQGGTGVANNSAATLTRSGNHALTITTTGTTSVTLPTSGTLGTGDVTAAASFAVDNVLVRSNGTGKGVQATGISVDDSDNLTGVNDVTVAGDFDISGATIVGTLPGASGGTGVANTGKTITLGGSLTTSGSFATTLTATATTGVTLPTTGTLSTLAGAESLTNKKLGSLTSNGLVTTSGGDGTLSITASTALTLKVELTIACSDETTAITAGNGKMTFRMPFAMTLTGVRASLTTAPTGSTFIADINESGSTILSTKLSIDASEKTSTTAASSVVISDSTLADDAEMTVDFDQVGSSVAGTGVKILLIGTRS